MKTKAKKKTNKQKKSLSPEMSGFSVFAKISKPSMEFLKSKVNVCSFKKGRFIFKEGQPAKAIYLIKNGAVALETYHVQRGPQIIDILKKGEVLGWSWLLAKGCWHFDALALEETEVFEISSGHLEKLMSDNPADGLLILKAFFPIVVNRMQKARNQTLNLYQGPREE